MTHRWIVPLLFVLLAAHPAGAQNAWTFGDAAAVDPEGRPFGELLVAVGERFVGAPYEAGMLDRDPGEPLVETFDRFDCVLFVETALAMAQGLAAGDTSREGFARRLEALRYRAGERDGYCSRLHYFSEWIHDNADRGSVEDLTALWGDEWSKRLGFMTERRELYPRIASNDSLFAELVGHEQRLAQRPLHVIPREGVASLLPRLRSGDIVAFATAIPGLDVTHTGLVRVDSEGRVGLLHASDPAGVVVSPDLQAYLQNKPSAVGILVARPIAPRP